MSPLGPDPGEPLERLGTGSTSGSLSEESAVPFRVGVCATGILSLTLGAGFPCLWDSDTLADELRGLPDAFRLVVGRWPRHGPAYYEARVRKLGVRETLTLPEFDDLAVAYEFLERRADAIATLARKAATLARTPDREHEYRYHANLGTIYAHLGRYDEALPELATALAIEPNAHFGRERYQIEAIRYVAAAKAQPRLWEDSDFLTHAGWSWHTRYIAGGRDSTVRASESDEALEFVDFRAAYEAIGGMLRFGGRDSAELFRTLGNVFADHGDLNLAWWSWQRALERGHPATETLRSAISGIEDHWKGVNQHHPWSGVIPPSKSEFEAARRNADAWVTAFQKLEAWAITQGEEPGNVDTLRWLVSEADREVPPYVPYSEPILAWIRKHWFLSSCYGLAIVAWLVSLSRRRRQEQRFAMQKRRARGKAPVRDSIPRRSDPPPTR